MNEWYYARDNNGTQEAAGPYDRDAISTMLTNGVLPPSVLLYHPRFAPNWTRADSIAITNELSTPPIQIVPVPLKSNLPAVVDYQPVRNVLVSRNRTPRKADPVESIVWLSLGIVFLLAVIIFIARDKSDTREKSPIAPSSHEVCMVVRSKVRECLKAPRDAEFVFGSDVATRLIGDKPAWRVQGELDAQNSFGVYLRSTYESEISYDSLRGTYTVAYIRLGGDFVYLSPSMRDSVKSLNEAMKNFNKTTP